METYAKQSKSPARTLSARAGHGQPDMATILQTYRNRTAQLAALTDDDDQALQGKFTTQLQEDDDEALQGKFVAQLQSDDEKEPLQQKAENRTGLPDQLKSGVENLSGYSLDAVKVHYNSPKPAQLQALAYTQGTDIHVGPGQERYLGHEAWHVVQQMQGRVQPTMQLQGVAVNDNEGLEREADVMGEKITSENYVSLESCCQRKNNINSEVNAKGYRLSLNSPSRALFQLKGIVQMKNVIPTIAGGTKGTSVSLHLDAGDSVSQGSVPLVDCDGWTELKSLELTKSTLSDDKKWVRFHLLNEHAGGPGDNPGNLTSTTALANQNSDWGRFEREVKNAIPRDGGAAAASVDFNVNVGYPSSNQTIWKKMPHGNIQVTTDAANYPNSVTGTLSVDGEESDVHLDAAAGLYGPEHFKKIPYFKRDDYLTGVNNWDTV